MGLVSEKSQKAMNRPPIHLPAAHRQPVDQGMAVEGYDSRQNAVDADTAPAYAPREHRGDGAQHRSQRINGPG